MILIFRYQVHPSFITGVATISISGFAEGYSKVPDSSASASDDDRGLDSIVAVDRLVHSA